MTYLDCITHNDTVLLPLVPFATGTYRVEYWLGKGYLRTFEYTVTATDIEYSRPYLPNMSYAHNSPADLPLPVLFSEDGYVSFAVYDALGAQVGDEFSANVEQEIY